ncbi:Glucocorticoid receptor-like (DNA-binding) [Glarea lozoyensis ATCC 20868]|uniref:Glucocorticoid receptor-like (DNA-binding) n=1 Tax=Glarea lozoyensis (strain ATCC 20868 / MF5171) TaxID=1116229 RepID=S3DSF0_GLAL2|nr:Glucocorticoid receptor-like (DNA-binding) [Glarea lozoyensis ATCC 20868]EPE29348.1 Glucocorticoid receptor-like (DNA-binding) [Glarea lozoyensis ATCC 20868]
MEAADSANRQSGILSITNRESADRFNTDRTYTSAPTMATLVSPASIYSNGPPPPYSNWPAPAAGLVSPPESRRTSDNKADAPPPLQTIPPHRQSLPSIHEALNTKSYTSPVSASLPPAHHPAPYSQGPVIPRTYPPSDHAPYSTHICLSQTRHPSPPRPIHPQQAHAFSHVDPPQNNYQESQRHPAATAPAAPSSHAQYPSHRHDPPRYDPDSQASERPLNSYSHQPQTGPYSYPPNSNQMSGPHDASYNQPRYPHDPRPVDEGWKGNTEDDRTKISPFKQGLKRRYMVWDFENYLSAINVSSGNIQSWSHHFHTITQEQQPRDHPAVPDRMPSLDSCNEMLENQETIRIFLEKMRDMISQQNEQTAMLEVQHRENTGKSAAYYDHEAQNNVYMHDPKGEVFGGPESKKRRGRAAPPGRCHSCNRAETPEWRRGPDGARTLCNACGLHYAKLTRKNTMKQSQMANGSSIRPKSMDGVSPRPL